MSTKLSNKVLQSDNRPKGSLAGFFALLLFGCGSVETPPDVGAACHDLVVRPCDSVEIPADVVSACHDVFLRRVAFAARCTGPSAAPSSADEQAYVEACAGIATAPGATLTPLDIKACADQMDTSPCLGGGVFPSCIGYWGDLLYPNHDKNGSFAPGEACFAQVQCDSGYCDHNAFETCGVCKRARAEGESCGEAMDHCIAGSCWEGTCQPDGKRLGAECTTHGIECQPALYCKQDKCVARGKAGESCDASTYCADGLVCLAEVCVALAADGAACSDEVPCFSGWCNGGTCAKRPTGLTAGEDCSVGFCRADLVCDESHVCVTLMTLSEGDTCTSSSMCKPGLYCHIECSPSGGCQDPSTCRPYPQPGEFCTPYAACAPGAYCVGFDVADLTKSTCVKLGAEGEACPCAGELACISDVCVSYGACQ